MRFSDTGPLGRDGQSRWLAASIASRRGPGGGCRAILWRGAVVGYVRLGDAAARTGAGDVELGLRLVRAAQGQGLAHEAARAVMAQAPGRVVAVVDPGNTPSVRLLHRLGLQYAREISFPGYDHPDHLYVQAGGGLSAPA